jgi:2-phosphosulfolactate phosphatase
VNGARYAGQDADVIVVVDVLSFSTAVDIAVSRGVTVYPYPRRDEELVKFARSVEAEVGGPRGECRYSLSPACYLRAERGTRVVLPSINGGAITRAVASRTVFAGCLRNATAVAHAMGRPDKVAIIPAGEQWPDGSLRPAIEDWLGAGAIIDRLDGAPSAEALAAREAFRAVRGRLDSLLEGSVSGRELADLGFVDDVRLAATPDVSDSAPVLLEGAYVRAGC